MKGFDPVCKGKWKANKNKQTRHVLYVLCLQTHQMDLVMQMRHALRMQTASGSGGSSPCEARAVSNSGGQPAGAHKTQHMFPLTMPRQYIDILSVLSSGPH